MNRRQAMLSFGAMATVVGVARSAAPGGETVIPLETDVSMDHLPSPAPADGGFVVLRNVAQRKILGAAFDRLIPADEHGPSATEAGCLEFLDAQLAGDYGAGKALYLVKPLDPANEAAIMGAAQFLATPRERYLAGIPALDAYARAQHKMSFAALPAEQIDAILSGMESGTVEFPGRVDATAFFELMLQNVREGYLSDPLYGGNRGMAGWKMIGFPGARYDYRPYLERRGQNLALAPISLIPEA